MIESSFETSNEKKWISNNDHQSRGAVHLEETVTISENVDISDVR